MSENQLEISMKMAPWLQVLAVECGAAINKAVQAGMPVETATDLAAALMNVAVDASVSIEGMTLGDLQKPHLVPKDIFIKNGDRKTPSEFNPGGQAGDEQG